MKYSGIWSQMVSYEKGLLSAAFFFGGGGMLLLLFIISFGERVYKWIKHIKEWRQILFCLGDKSECKTMA